MLANRIGSALRVGITGSRGLIGQALLEYLIGLDRPPVISAFPGDVLDRDSVKLWAEDFGPSIVFHLAAKVPSRVDEASKDLVREVNELGPAFFASAVAKSQPASTVRFIYVSTSHVYASSPQPISESGLVSPLNFYGQTKLDGEQRLQTLEARGDIKLAIMRLFSIYSEKQGPEYLFGSLRRRLQVSQTSHGTSLPGWNNIRDFIHADHAARIIGDLGLGNFEGTVNVGSGRGISVKDFAEEQFGKRFTTSSRDKDQSPTALVADVSLMNELLQHVG